MRDIVRFLVFVLLMTAVDVVLWLALGFPRQSHDWNMLCAGLLTILLAVREGQADA